MKSFTLNPTPNRTLNRVGTHRRGVRLFAALCVFCGHSLLSKFQVSSFQFLAILALCAMLHAPCANAAGMSSIHSLESGTVTITNTQKHSSWVPVALLFKFDAPATGTITIERLTGSTTFLLTSCAVSNSQHAVWIPESAFPFKLNDVLSVTSTITNATVEIIRKADQ